MTSPARWALMALPNCPEAVAAARVLDAIVEHHGAVMADAAADDHDAVVAGIRHRIARNGETAGVGGQQRHVGAIRDGRAGDFAGDAREADAVAAGCQYGAVHNPHAARLLDMHQPLVVRQRPQHAVEREAGERHRLAALRRNERRPAAEDEPRRAAHTDERCARRQPQAAGAVDAGRQCQRHAGLRGAVDRALQRRALVIRTAGAHAHLGGIEPESRDRRRSRGRGRRHGLRKSAERRCGARPFDELATCGVHGFVRRLGDGARATRSENINETEARPRKLESS
jgi:hypothetical protein